MRKTLILLALMAVSLSGCGAQSSGAGGDVAGLPAAATVLPPEAAPTQPPQITFPGTGVYTAWQNDPTAYPEGCSGMFVGGGVIDAGGAPVVFMLVRLSGRFGTEDALSGTAGQYGESGYELLISPELLDTSGEVFLQLFDPETEQPVSDLLALDTYADCARNLHIVHWVEE